MSHMGLKIDLIYLLGELVGLCGMRPSFLPRSQQESSYFKSSSP
eukprot:TCALIF_04456-PA protein Name:"Protein of unknown function" AED:0.17 eAED:0.17 QI:151/1/0.5/1/1/1/2/0/43